MNVAAHCVKSFDVNEIEFSYIKEMAEAWWLSPQDIVAEMKAAVWVETIKDNPLNPVYTRENARQEYTSTEKQPASKEKKYPNEPWKEGWYDFK